MEGAKPGSVIGTVRSHDTRELPESGQVTYTVVGGTDRDGTFVVDRLTGDVYLARELDYERDYHYTIHIEVVDFSSTLPSSHMVLLDIDVQDSNDHAPHFPEDPVTIVISESTEPGMPVYTFQAADGDGSGPNSELYYTIQQQGPGDPGLLNLDPRTGVLSLGQPLDHEIISSLVMVVQATDSPLNASQRRWGSVTARVFVTDENDNAPVFTSPSVVSVMEDQPVGFVVLYVMARDADQGENGRMSYRIQAGDSAGKFSINPSTGESFIPSLRTPLIHSVLLSRRESRNVSLAAVPSLFFSLSLSLPLCVPSFSPSLFLSLSVSPLQPLAKPSSLPRALLTCSQSGLCVYPFP